MFGVISTEDLILLTAFLSFLTALVGTIKSFSNGKRTYELKMDVDSRLKELLEAKTELARQSGALEGTAHAVEAVKAVVQAAPAIAAEVVKNGLQGS